MAHEYRVKIGEKLVRLVENDNGSWEADGGLDPLGFTYDPDVPPEGRVFQLEYLVGHGASSELEADDLAHQFSYLKNKDENYLKLIYPIILRNIRSGKIKPEQVTLGELENILIALSSSPASPAGQKILPKLIDQNIISVLGLDNLAFAEKKEILDTFTQTVMQAVFLREASKMPQAKRQEFLKILEGKNEEAIGAFLKANCTDLDKVLTEEALKFKYYILNHSQKVDKKIEMGKIVQASGTS